MKIILKNINGDNVNTISQKVTEPFQKILQKLNNFKEPLEVNIFLINERINIYQLAKFKVCIEKLNIHSLNIFSNNRETVLAGKSLKIDSILINEKELESRLLFEIKKKPDDILFKGTVRSGDRISSNSDLCIIGDVNPGAIISAKRNVYVWGKLLGIALAGEGGHKDSIIASLYLNPVQLRISNIVAIGPKEKPKNFFPELACLEKETIIIKPYLIDS